MKAATLFESLVLCFYKISIHAAREGGDALRKAVYINIAISIHAAREGGDMYDFDESTTGDDFNPRRP